MTDKQIIDGVDVSECEYYFDKKCRCMDASIMQDFYLCPQCNSNPNCYYKQYKRSEAQCEGMFVTHTDLEMKYKAKEQECEWLKVENKKLEEELLDLKLQFEEEQLMYEI